MLSTGDNPMTRLYHHILHCVAAAVGLALCLAAGAAPRSGMMKDSPVKSPEKGALKAKHPHVFYRDRVHANEIGEQILSKILMAFFKP
jgi:hypothetical protein